MRNVLAGLPRPGVAPNTAPCSARVTLAKQPQLRATPYAGLLFNGGGPPLNLDAPSCTLLASMGGNRTPIIDERALYDGAVPWVVEYHAALTSKQNVGCATDSGASCGSIQDKSRASKADSSCTAETVTSVMLAHGSDFVATHSGGKMAAHSDGNVAIHSDYSSMLGVDDDAGNTHKGCHKAKANVEQHATGAVLAAAIKGSGRANKERECKPCCQDAIRAKDAPTAQSPPAWVPRLTVAEAARLQDFPEGYSFCGAQSSQYRQVGNSVPPKLAQAVALALRFVLDNDLLPAKA